MKIAALKPFSPWRPILLRLTAYPLWWISEVFQWLWGFFEQAGNWFEDSLLTEDGPDYSGFKYLFAGEAYRWFNEGP